MSHLVVTSQPTDPSIKTVRSANIADAIIGGGWDSARDIASWESLKGVAWRAAAVGGGCVVGGGIGFFFGSAGAIEGCGVGAKIVTNALGIEFGYNLAKTIHAGSSDLVEMIMAEGPAKDAAARSFGRDAANFAAMVFVHRLGKKGSPTSQSPLKLQNEAGQSIDLELVGTLKDGTEVWGIPKPGSNTLPVRTNNTNLPAAPAPTAQNITTPKLTIPPVFAGIRPRPNYPAPYDDPKTQKRDTDEVLAKSETQLPNRIDATETGKTSVEIRLPLDNVLAEIFKSGPAKTTGSTPSISAGASPLELLEGLKAVDNPMLRSIQQNIENKSYGPNELAFLDAMFAARNVDGNSKTIVSEINNDAGDLLSKAFSGDKEAQLIILERLNLIKELDAEKRRRIQSLTVSIEIQPLRPEELVVTHATKYLPATGASGDLIVQASFDAIGTKVAPSTVHTSLNDKVAPHSHSWESAPYVIVANYTDMTKANGDPAILMAVDTFWSRNPGEGLHFPNAILVLPSPKDIDAPFVRDGNKTYYKSGNLQMSDYQKSDELTRSSGNPYSQIYPLLDGLFKEDLYFSNPVPTALWDKSKANFLIYKNQEAALSEFNKTAGNISILDACTKLFKDLGLTEAALGSNPQQTFNDAVKIFAERIGSQIAGNYQRLAVGDAVEKLGGKVQPGGDASWRDNDMNERLEALAVSLGIASRTHMSSAWGRNPGYSETSLKSRIDQPTRRVELIKEDIEN